MMPYEKHTEPIVRLTARIIALVFVLSTISFSALASFKANVYKVSMPVYASPSTSAKKLGSLKSGTEVTVVAYKGDWTKIKYKGYTGYAQFRYLISQKRIKAYSKGKYKVYTLPSSSAKKLCTLSRGSVVYVAGMCGDYYLVENKSGSAAGYIEKSALSAKTNESGDGSASGESAMPASLKSSQSSYSSSLSDEKKIEYAIYNAQNQLGKPYSTNPDPPSSYDCAGLTHYCYGKAGVSLKASAYGQGYDSSYTKIKSASSLKRGDVVIFNTNEDDSDLSDHTGIYLGSGYFIHASSAGEEVMISTLSSGYYSRTFSWGLRILD
jgi:cell wall-associated NlpC family hydrolase